MQFDSCTWTVELNVTKEEWWNTEVFRRGVLDLRVYIRNTVKGTTYCYLLETTYHTVRKGGFFRKVLHFERR